MRNEAFRLDMANVVPTPIRLENRAATLFSPIVENE
jgi:hypothetical protein